MTCRDVTFRYVTVLSIEPSSGRVNLFRIPCEDSLEGGGGAPTDHEGEGRKRCSLISGRALINENICMHTKRNRIK